MPSTRVKKCWNIQYVNVHLKFIFSKPFGDGSVVEIEDDNLFSECTIDWIRDEFKTSPYIFGSVKLLYALFVANSYASLVSRTRWWSSLKLEEAQKIY